MNTDRPAERLAIDDLVRHDDLQARVGVSEETVEHYASLFRRGISLPPLDGFRLDERVVLVNGHHRYLAARKAGLTHIDVLVHEGDRREATLFALAANATNGLHRNNADKRKAVATMLADKEWQAWSDGAIAAHLMVSDRFVSKMREELAVPTPAIRKGRDGRAIDVSAIGQRSASAAPSRIVKPKPGPTRTPKRSQSVTAPPSPPSSSEEDTTTATKEKEAVVAPLGASTDYFFADVVPGAAWLRRNGNIVGIRIGIESTASISLDPEVAPASPRFMTIEDLEKFAEGINTDLRSSDHPPIKVLVPAFDDVLAFVAQRADARAALSLDSADIVRAFDGGIIFVTAEELTSEEAREDLARKQVLLVSIQPDAARDFVCLARYAADGRDLLPRCWVLRAPGQCVLASTARFVAKRPLVGLVLIEAGGKGGEERYADTGVEVADFDGNHGPLGIRTEDEDDERDEDGDEDDECDDDGCEDEGEGDGDKVDEDRDEDDEGCDDDDEDRDQDDEERDEDDEVAHGDADE